MENWVMDKIRRAKAEQWRFLDLGNGGLTDLPPELLDLEHLEELNLSHQYRDQNSQGWLRTENVGRSNNFETFPDAIETLGSLRTIHALGQFIRDISSLSRLRSLSSLTFTGLHFTDAKSLSTLSSLTSLEIPLAQFTNLDSLCGLDNLKLLRLPFSAVTEVSSVASLTNLLLFDVACTRVSDITPLGSIPHLGWINASSTKINNIEAITDLPLLVNLDISGTNVIDLSPLRSHDNLLLLNISNTRVPSTNQIQHLTKLRSLSMYGLPILDVSELANLRHLTSLQIGATNITSISPISTLPHLTSLYMSSTHVNDIEEIANAKDLEALTLANCNLHHFPRFLLSLPALSYLTLFGNPFVDCPREILGKGDWDNCLNAVRTHFVDQSNGTRVDSELKLMLVGNGNVGKTSIAKRLIHNDFDAGEISTHAIRLQEWTIGIRECNTRLNVFDFGGQDIYHGTHSLFMSGPAIFLIVWDRITEQIKECELDGVRFENHPLDYWLDQVRSVSTRSAVIVIENKCDDGVGVQPPGQIGEFPLVHVSAMHGFGIDALLALIHEATKRMLRTSAPHEIGSGRFAVKETLRQYRREDERLPPSDRRYRRITRKQFDELCSAQGGNVSSSTELLKYFHETGTLYHDPQLFNGEIILDQGWAIEAIYTIFHRAKCYRQLRELHGRFRLSTLSDLAWDEAGFSLNEQRLFLGFMQSCSLCFRVDRTSTHNNPDDALYLAPDLLPEREAVQKHITLLNRLYINDNNTSSFWFRYSHQLLHRGAIRRLLVRIGQEFGDDAIYWRNGLIFDSSSHRTLAELNFRRKTASSPSGGEITIRLYGHETEALLNELRGELECLVDVPTNGEQFASLDGHEWIDLRKLDDAAITGTLISDRQRAINVQPFLFLHRRSIERGTPRLSRIPRKQATSGEPADATSICNANAVFLSYAWGDEHEPGVSREAIVDRLYDSLMADGFHVVRDRKNLGYKGLVSEFMQQIGHGSRIITVISDKYLRSPYCMWELYLIHQFSFLRRDFRERIFPIVLPDARIYSPTDRLELVKFWEHQRDSLSRQAREVLHVLSCDGAIRDIERYRKIAESADTMLAFIADMNTLDAAAIEEMRFAKLKAAIREGTLTRNRP